MTVTGIQRATTPTQDTREQMAIDGGDTLIRLQSSQDGQPDLGLLNFYSVSPGRFAAADDATAHPLAGHVSVAIAAAHHAASLTHSIETRTVIGQAQGLLMERFCLDAVQAFAVLRRYSQNGNVKLHDLASRVIETRQLPAAPPSRSSRA